MTDTTRTPKPCVAYYRVSTKRQGDSGLGLEAQRGAVERFVERAGCAELIGPPLPGGDDHGTGKAGKPVRGHQGPGPLGRRGH